MSIIWFFVGVLVGSVVVVFTLTAFMSAGAADRIEYINWLERELERERKGKGER